MQRTHPGPRNAPIFWTVFAIGLAAPLYWLALEPTSPSTPSWWMLGWSASPFVVAALLWLSKAWYAAWGWLVAVAVFTFTNCASVFLWPQGSTAALSLLFAPLWAFMLVGPIGAGVGVFIGSLRARS